MAPQATAAPTESDSDSALEASARSGPVLTTPERAPRIHACVQLHARARLR